MEDFHDKENKKDHVNTPPQLVTCHSCNNKFSERAQACPKCGSAQTKSCQVCHSLIPAVSSQCPKCGDPSPFYVQNNNQENPEKIATNYQTTHDGEGKSVMKRILITAPFVLFIMLIIGAVKELMQPGLLRGMIIVICFLSIFKFWGWIKD